MITHYNWSILGKAFQIAGRELLGTITSVATQDHVIALTFDDGPHPKFTPRLLEILKGHQARATFFLVGEAARKYPDLVKQIAIAGHAIGNHSWDHPSFPLLDRRQRKQQIIACAEAVAPYGERLFRPPYGHQSIASRLTAFFLDYQVITWDTLADDWRAHDAEWMAERIQKGIKPGSIVCLHDAICRSIQDVPQYDRQAMLSALSLVLLRLGGDYRFVTIPELFRHGRPKTENWYRKAPPTLLGRLCDHPMVARRFTARKESEQC